MVSEPRASKRRSGVCALAESSHFSQKGPEVAVDSWENLSQESARWHSGPVLPSSLRELQELLNVGHEVGECPAHIRSGFIMETQYGRISLRAWEANTFLRSCGKALK